MPRKKPSSKKPNGDPSRSEKRVLWEVRNRYKINNNKNKRTSSNRQKQSANSHSTTPIAKPSRRPISGQKRQAHWGRRIAPIIFLLVIASGGIFGYRILAAGNKISSADSSLIGQLKDLLFNGEEFLNGEQDGRINILLLAIGGEGHKGQNLADTIMVASIRPKTNEVALLSIPRDLYVQVPNEDYYSKINAVHAYGEVQKEGQGPEAMREKVEEITGLPIHYYVRADFVAFKGIVDAVGGVNITIDNSFYDYWHKIDFQAGTEKMNGERALAYVRARYVEGPEGGDFKRAGRQQQILLALREKVFSVNTALDFRAVNAIISELSDNIRTDMQLWEMKRFFELARLIDHSAIHSVVLTTGHNGVLTGGTEVLGGVPASVLRTRTGDYSEIQNIAANIFSEGETLTPSHEPAEEVTKEEIPETTPEEEVPAETSKPTVEIRNGTNTAGLAAGTQEDLENKGYEVTTIGNAANRSTETTIVYIVNSDATEGAKALAAELNTTTSTNTPEGEATSEAQVLIILGNDAQ